MISPEHLIAYLKGNAAIAAAVGMMTSGGHTGIPIIPELPTPVAEFLPRRAIVVTGGGGPEIPGTTHNLTGGTNDVICYGKTLADAWALNGIVYNHLEKIGSLNANGKHVVSIKPTGAGGQGRHPDGDFPFVFCEYELVISGG